MTDDICPWGEWRHILWMNLFTPLTIFAVFSGLCFKWQSCAGRCVVYITPVTLMGRKLTNGERVGKKKKTAVTNEDFCPSMKQLSHFSGSSHVACSFGWKLWMAWKETLKNCRKSEENLTENNSVHITTHIHMVCLADFDQINFT